MLISIAIGFSTWFSLLNAALLRKSLLIQSSQCSAEPIGVVVCARGGRKRGNTDRQTDGRSVSVTLDAHARRAKSIVYTGMTKQGDTRFAA